MKLKKLFSFISIRMKLLTEGGLLSVGIVGVCGYLGVYKASRIQLASATGGFIPKNT